MNILQKIFTDYYEKIVYELHPRQAIVENVDKMIHCGNSSYGGALFGCDECGHPFDAKVGFALPAVTNTLLTVPPPCLLRSSMFHIVTASLRSMMN